MKAILHITIYAVLFLSLAACALLCVETIWRGSFSEAMMWASRQVSISSLCVIGIAAFYALIYLLSGKMTLSLLIINVFLMLIALVQHYKLDFRGENFLLGDIMLFKEAIMIVDRFTITVPWYVLFPCALMLISPLCAFGIRIKGNRRTRLAAWGVCAVLFVQSACGILNINDRTTANTDYYYLNGLIPGLVWSRPRRLTKPENYTEKQINDILAQYTQEDTAEVLPDIFFVMSESLYDLHRLEQIHLSADTMPYFRTLQDTYWGGNLCVVPFGGGTVHTEYSVLTGYLPDVKSIAPYLNQHMQQEGACSIPRQLSQYGYHTIAMHPNIGSMYNRNHAYPYLGFDDTVFIDSMSAVYDYVGGYPSDRYLFDELIRQYENRPMDKPFFSFTVTFQNHGAYDYDYDKRDIFATDSAGNIITEATTYANALKASDEALETLIEYMSKQNRPIILVLFGDHAPSLETMGIPLKQGPENTYLYYTTPILVFSNYGFEMPFEQGEVLSSYRLGATLLHAIGIRSDRYYNYLADPSRENLTKTSGMIAKNGQFLSDPEKYTRAVEELNLLYYDRVDGKHYSRKEHADE